MQGYILLVYSCITMKSLKSLSPLKANTFRSYLISIVLQKLTVIMFFLSLAVFLIIFLQNLHQWYKYFRIIIKKKKMAQFTVTACYCHLSLGGELECWKINFNAGVGGDG